MRILTMLVVAAVLASCTPDDGVPTPSTGDAELEVVEGSYVVENNVIEIQAAEEPDCLGGAVWWDTEKQQLYTCVGGGPKVVNGGGARMLSDDMVWDVDTWNAEERACVECLANCGRVEFGPGHMTYDIHCMGGQCNDCIPPSPEPSVIQVDLGDEGRIEAEEEIYVFTDRGGTRQCDVWNDATGEYEREPCTRQDTVPELSPEEVDNGPLEDRMLEPVDE